jgi:ubiquitin fusion degradation protein 1
VFTGTGQRLNDRNSSQGKGKQRALSTAAAETNWGHGQTLASKPSQKLSPGRLGAGGASVPVPPQRNGRTTQNRSPTPDWGVDDDEDVIVIDSD